MQPRRSRLRIRLRVDLDQLHRNGQGVSPRYGQSSPAEVVQFKCSVVLAVAALLGSQFALANHGGCLDMLAHAASVEVTHGHGCDGMVPSADKAQCDAHCAAGEVNADCGRIPPSRRCLSERGCPGFRPLPSSMAYRSPRPTGFHRSFPRRVSPRIAGNSPQWRVSCASQNSVRVRSRRS